ncbi:hypothetical protein EON64_02285 [archaeon]|nr:MAG: hypothetical protein EON64_02285 [archaeon]
MKELAGRDVNWRNGINIVDPDTGLTPLMLAAVQGKVQIGTVLIDRGADLEFAEAKKGRTALHIAARCGQVGMLNELLKRHSLVNSTDKFKKIPLMHACKGGYLDCVKSLISRGAGVNMADENGFTPLHYAARYGHHEVINALVNAGAALEIRDNLDGKTALHWAAQFGRKDTVIMLLELGAKINRRSTVEKVTALMLASREGYKSIVSVLIQKKADANMTDIYGWTALHFAASWGRRDTAHILIVEGLANINARDLGKDKTGGITPLIVAAKGSHIEVMKVLLHYGADVNLPELIEHNTAIHCAAVLGLNDVVRCLIEYNASINIQNEVLGHTALMLAAKFGRGGVLIVLLNHLADLNILDKKGQTALEYANNYNFRDVFLSAIVHISPAAKANIVPWLEVQCPLLVRNSMYGGPSVFMTTMLYRRKGLYYGLYQLTGDCDVYLMYCLVMVAAGCNQAMKTHSKDSPDLLHKINEVEDMLEKCVAAQQMCIDSVFNDAFVIGRVPCEAMGLYDIKYFASAYVSGPLALYIDQGFNRWLNTPQLQGKTDEVFYSCLKDVGSVIDGYGEHCGTMLRLRYSVWAMLLLEGIGQLIFIGLVIYYTIYVNHSRNMFNLHASHPYTQFNMLENIIVVMVASLTLYELGLIEEKRWKTSPSVVFDFKTLEKTRSSMVWRHFFEHPYKIFDAFTLLLSISWVILRVVAMNFGSETANKLYGSSSQLLVLSCVPSALGLIRYVAAFYRPLAVEMLTIFAVFQELSVFLLIFSCLGLGFGVSFYAIFHNDVDAFQSPALTLIALFNAILRVHDDSIFDTSNNKISGLVIGAVFLLLGIVVFFNAIIGSIAANYAKHMTKSEARWQWIKSRYIQQFLLVQEKSPMCMLPAPFNLVPSLLYFPHVYVVWRARLALEQRVTVSIAGLASDALLHILMLLPAATVEYFRIYLMSDEAGHVSKLYYLLTAPLGIMYCALCLLYKLCADSPVKVILKSRLSDGRLRISYDQNRDFYEAIALSRFEDQRLFQDLEQFAAPLFYKDGDFEQYRQLVKRPKMPVSSLDRGFNESWELNQRPLDHSPEEYKHKSLWRAVVHSMTGVWRKRHEDHVGRKIRIAPISPYLQLANMQQVGDVYPPGSDMRDEFKDKDDVSLHNEMSQDDGGPNLNMASSYYNPADPSQEIVPLAGSNSALYACHYDGLNASSKKQKPGIWWIGQDSGEKKFLSESNKFNASTASRPMMSPYQAGILSASQWQELAADEEPRNAHITSHGQAGEGNLVSSLVKSQTEHLNRQPSLDDTTFKKASEEIHLPTNEESEVLAAPSFYFPHQRFPPIFRPDERKRIFEKVLPDVFRDDFTHAIESSERNLNTLELRMQKLEAICLQQTQLLQQLVVQRQHGGY